MAGPSDKPDKPDVDELDEDEDELDWGEEILNKSQAFLEYFYLSVCPY